MYWCVSSGIKLAVSVDATLTLRLLPRMCMQHKSEPTTTPRTQVQSDRLHRNGNEKNPRYRRLHKNAARMNPYCCTQRRSQSHSAGQEVLPSTKLRPPATFPLGDAKQGKADSCGTTPRDWLQSTNHRALNIVRRDLPLWPRDSLPYRSAAAPAFQA